VLILVLLFIVLPIAELYVIIKVGEAIGVLPTIALLIADSFIGVALARSQGRLAWMRFNQALAEGRVPAREVFDGAMVILGGALLLTPGFITDIVGILCLIPPTRALFRGLAARMARRRVVFRVGTMGSGPDRGPREGTYERDYGFGGGRPYDVEGTAQEVSEPEGELERGDGE
jgi:UPF0716 protein FxsA